MARTARKAAVKNPKARITAQQRLARVLTDCRQANAR
jgi:hypothetical protein